MTSFTSSESNLYNSGLYTPLSNSVLYGALSRDEVALQDWITRVKVLRSGSVPCTSRSLSSSSKRDQGARFQNILPR
jgi:hypothetical protein